MTEVEQIKLEELKTDEALQARSRIDVKLVAEYQEMIEQGEELDPIEYVDLGDCKKITDGNHRYRAYQQAGRETIPAVGYKGDEAEAVRRAAGANQKHGLKRTNEDKRRAVLMLLNNEKWSKESDRSIAKMAGVSNNFVSTLKRELSPAEVSSDDTTARVNSHIESAAPKKVNPGPKSKPDLVKPPQPTLAVEPVKQEPEVKLVKVDFSFLGEYEARFFDACSDSGMREVELLHLIVKRHFDRIDKQLKQ